MNSIRNVCYVTTTERIDCPFLDDASRYRCYHPAGELANAGVNSRVVSMDLFLRYPMAWYDAYVFHQPVYSEQLATFIHQANKKGTPMVADFGELVSENGTVDPEMSRALCLFDRFSVGTSSIKEQVLSDQPDAKVTLTPEYLSPVQIELSGLFPRRNKSNKTFQILYLADGENTEADFSLLEDALWDFLETTPNARYCHVGSAIPPGQLADHPKTRSVGNFNRQLLPNFLSRADALILPHLAGPTNHCKSGIRFLEAACQDVPVVATPTSALEPHQGHYFPAIDAEAWLAALRGISESPIEEGALAGYARDHGTSEGRATLYFSIFT